MSDKGSRAALMQWRHNNVFFGECLPDGRGSEETVEKSDIQKTAYTPASWYKFPFQSGRKRTRKVFSGKHIDKGIWARRKGEGAGEIPAAVSIGTGKGPRKTSKPK